MEITQAGLPNSCSRCGLPVSNYWFADNQDIARSGEGICIDCYDGEWPEEFPLEAYNGIGHTYAIGLAKCRILTLEDLAAADYDAILETWQSVVSLHPAQKARLKTLINKAKNNDLHVYYKSPNYK